MAADPADEPGPFQNELEFVGWVLLHCGLADALAFSDMGAGKRRSFIEAAIGRAEKRRLDELEQLARLMGAANGT